MQNKSKDIELIYPFTINILRPNLKFQTHKPKRERERERKLKNLKNYRKLKKKNLKLKQKAQKKSRNNTFALKFVELCYRKLALNRHKLQFKRLQIF
jgi:hypothetical protein